MLKRQRSPVWREKQQQQQQEQQQQQGLVAACTTARNRRDAPVDEHVIRELQSQLLGIKAPATGLDGCAHHNSRMAVSRQRQ